MNPLFVSSTIILALSLAACGSTAPAQPAAVIPAATNVSATTVSTDENLTRTDQQGAVIVEVTPLNLDQPGQTLDFQVSMSTHSVDLSMDLTVLATLETDTGLQVGAVAWDGPSGGHHVSGTLSFPATAEGKLLFEGASQFTLTIRSVDAAARMFTWSVNR